MRVKNGNYCKIEGYAHFQKWPLLVNGHMTTLPDSEVVQ